VSTSSINYISAATAGETGGLGAGIDVGEMVDAAMSAARAPEQQWEDEETTLSAQSTVLNSLSTQLTALQTSIQALTDPDGQFDSKTATSTDSSVVTATAGNSASVGTHTIVVSQLATTSSYSSSALTDGDTTFGEGTFYIKIGTNTPVAVDVTSSNDTLNTLASYINGQDLGVTATVVTDSSGARLALYSNTSGAAGNIMIDPTGYSNTTGLSFTAGTTGVDASLTVDGIQIDSSSNTISTVIPGVTLTLTGTNTSTTPAEVSVEPDTDGASTALNNFVTAYNTLITSINAQFTYDASSGESAPPLLGDSGLEIVQQELADDVSFMVTGNTGVESLADLGITTNDDGTLTVDSSQLTDVLSSQFNDVQSFLQNGSTAFAQNFANDLDSLTNPISGPLNVELTQDTQTITSLQSQIADFESTLTAKQAELTDEYSTIDTTLEELPQMLAQVSSQLGSLSG
jgi:flagellar hook-associated protein 2